MILWVKAIASRARLVHPGFLVIPQNGAQLLADPHYTLLYHQDQVYVFKVNP